MKNPVILNACLLGLIQRVAEFLPISFGGHLVIAQGYLPALGEKAMTLAAVGYYCLALGGGILLLWALAI
jgi:undecaprenyl pyrophosphate phosphatase UppP